MGQVEDAQYALSTIKHLGKVKNGLKSDRRTISEHLNLSKTTVREMVTKKFENEGDRRTEMRTSDGRCAKNSSIVIVITLTL